MVYVQADGELRMESELKRAAFKLTSGHWELYLPYRLEELRSVLTQPS